ncbi:Ubiquitin fusion degradation UFD1 family protein [Pelomyxa schiedti]|nr:Ubiquitin fusion degradation UFD1 family protein [Pelomyxa schiedti]
MTAASDVEVRVKYHGRVVAVSMPLSATVDDLQNEIMVRTGVEPSSQKLMGISVRGYPDDRPLGTVLRGRAKGPLNIMLMGLAPDEMALTIAKEEQWKEDTADVRAAIAAHETEENQRRAQELERENRLREQAQRERERQQAEQLRRAQAWNYDRSGLWSSQSFSLRTSGGPHPPGVYPHNMPPMAAESDPNAALTITLQVFSAAMNPKHEESPMNLELADKFILPPSVLDSIVSRRIAMPIVFRVESPSPNSAAKTSLFTHGSALEFTSPEGIAYLPFWMMNKLLIQEGDSAIFSTVTLPRGSSVVLQPLSAEWVRLGSPKAILEEHLSRFQSLSTGDVIHIPYQGHTLPLNVVSVSSETTEEIPAVIIAETDLTINLLPPVSVDSLPKHTTLENAVPVDDRLDPDKYAYFTFVVDFPTALKISVEPITDTPEFALGDPDLYLSHSCEYPSLTCFTWEAQEQGATAIILDTSDKNYTQGRYFLGVHAYKHPLHFKLILQPCEGSLLGTASSVVGTDSVTCSNCLQQISSASSSMHELHCRRRNTRCSKCGKVMLINQRDKHEDISHTLLKCHCGALFEQKVLMIHMQTECPQRLVPCSYCELQCPAATLGDHQNACGSKTTNCPICDFPLARKELQNHMIQAHTH